MKKILLVLLVLVSYCSYAQQLSDSLVRVGVVVNYSVSPDGKYLVFPKNNLDNGVGRSSLNLLNLEDYSIRELFRPPIDVSVDCALFMPDSENVIYATAKVEFNTIINLYKYNIKT